MRYIAFREDGSVIQDFSHGCWGKLHQTSYLRNSDKIDAIKYLIDYSGVRVLAEVYGIEQEEAYKLLFKGYDVEFEKSPAGLITWVIVKNLSGKYKQETMLRLFGLRSACCAYQPRTFLEKCKAEGISAQAAIVLMASFYCVNTGGSALDRNRSSNYAVAPSLSTGGAILYSETCISDMRRFLKGDFNQNTNLKDNNQVWGVGAGYTSGSTGRYVQEACSRSPIGSLKLAAYFYDTTNNPWTATLVGRNREDRKQVGYFSMREMPGELFFSLIKAIVNKKKMPECVALTARPESSMAHPAYHKVVQM